MMVVIIFIIINRVNRVVGMIYSFGLVLLLLLFVLVEMLGNVEGEIVVGL